MDEYSDSSPEKKSQFNSAIAQLYRLDDLWKDSHRHSREINYAKWNEDLDRIWLELSSDSDDVDKKKIDDINMRIASSALYAATSQLRITNVVLYSRLINYQKKLLLEKEVFLRALLNKQGKGSQYKDEIEDYMD